MAAVILLLRMVLVAVAVHLLREAQEPQLLAVTVETELHLAFLVRLRRMLEVGAEVDTSPEQSEPAARAAVATLILLQPLIPALLAAMEQPIPVVVVAAVRQQTRQQVTQAATAAPAL